MYFRNVIKFYLCNVKRLMEGWRRMHNEEHSKTSQSVIRLIIQEGREGRAM